MVGASLNLHLQDFILSKTENTSIVYLLMPNLPIRTLRNTWLHLIFSMFLKTLSSKVYYQCTWVSTSVLSSFDSEFSWYRINKRFSWNLVLTTCHCRSHLPAIFAFFILTYENCGDGFWSLLEISLNVVPWRWCEIYAWFIVAYF
jgi:hypothetical protein